MQQTFSPKLAALAHKPKELLDNLETQGSPSTYDISRWLLFRLLGVAYLAVFVSLWPQISGLLGPDGIAPVSSLLDRIAMLTGAERYYFFPTLCWLGSSEAMLHVLCVTGIVAAGLLTLGIAQGPSLVLLWVLHLSLNTVSEGFLSTQGDHLLLEAGFLGIFMASFRVLPSFKQRQAPSFVILWLLRLALVRALVWPGVLQLSRLISGETDSAHLLPSSLSASTWFNWHVHQWPVWIQQSAGLAFLATALTVPFLLFMPRKFRATAGVLLVLHQVVSVATGGQVLFAYLAAGLSILVLDDMHWTHFAPSGLTRRLLDRCSEVSLTPVRSVAIGMAAGAVLFTTFGLLAEGVAGTDAIPEQVGLVVGLSEPFQIVNRYDQAPQPTIGRQVLVLEGSLDGRTWKAYQLPQTSDDMTKPPSLVLGDLARLDTLLAVAARTDVSQNPWVRHLMTRLLEGSPSVLALFKDNPFPDGPPNYIRAVRYEYRFTDSASKRDQGRWWRREYRGLYCPVQSTSEPLQIASLVDGTVANSPFGVSRGNEWVSS